MRLVSAFLALGLAGHIHLAHADVPNVVADIAPLHSLVSQVMDGVGEPKLLMQPGVSPHDYSLRPSEAGYLDSADLVFWIGHDLTPWLEHPLETLAASADRFEMLEVDGTIELLMRQSAVFEDEDHGQEAHDHDHAHDHEGIDPHAWLNPNNAVIWLDFIATTLGQHDPENAGIYTTNAKAAKQNLQQVQTEIAAQLADFPANRILFFHDAYQHFERQFGLSAVGAISAGEAIAPGPARLSSLRDAVARSELKCAFSEAQFDPALIETLAAGKDVRFARLDPLGAGLEPGLTLYENLLRSFATEIAACR